MSAAVAAAASAAISGSNNSSNSNNHSNELLRRQIVQVSDSVTLPLSRYELLKRLDWSTFGQYLRNHRPPLTISHCSGEDVVEFLRYLDQSGKTMIHSETCANFGNLRPPGICMCPLKPACYNLDALIGRLRVAFGENGGSYGMNPFKAPAVRLYIEEKRAAYIQRPCRDDIVFRTAEDLDPSPRIEGYIQF